jgi:hypothetical protein
MSPVNLNIGHRDVCVPLRMSVPEADWLREKCRWEHPTRHPGECPVSAPEDRAAGGDKHPESWYVEGGTLA